MYLEDYEPRHDPTVIPLYGVSLQTKPNAARPTDAGQITKTGIAGKKLYSVVDYHESYLTGELTPTAVAKALLRLIRQDDASPAEHSIAWWQCREDLIMDAAKASTMRYKNKQSLGVLDGVPTGIKDEYDVDGYRTCLGSKKDYTPQEIDGHSYTSWCVKKLQEAGAINMGKLSMNEFGLGKCIQIYNFVFPLSCIKQVYTQIKFS